MKCPECLHQQNHSSGLTCTKCGYRYALDPKSYPYFADGFFLAVIRRASGNQTHHFTRNQLYAAFSKHTRKKTKVPIAVGAVVLAVGLALFLAHWSIASFVTVIGIVLLIISLAFKVKPKRLDKAIQLWTSKGRDIPKLITEPQLHDPPQAWPESDIYDYGVEKILIVQRDELVDLFVLNHWHADERAIVFSESGYPEYIVERAQTLLDERSDLPIFLLHDANAQGLGMRRRIEEKGIISFKHRTVIDLGLKPEDTTNLSQLKKDFARGGKTGLPVDAIPYAQLSRGTALALAGELTFSELLVPDELARNESSFSAHFG